jgi:hypothetical protein
MSSIRQIAANRSNSQKSTGPRTADGKAASSRNSLKSGVYAKSLIIRGEKFADLESLIDDFFDVHQPVGADERSLVDSLIVNEWLLRRMNRCEPQLWEKQFAAQDKRGEYDQKKALGEAFYYDDKTILNLQRRINSLHRILHRSRADLARLQKPRQRPTPPPSPSPELASFHQKSPDPARPPDLVPVQSPTDQDLSHNPTSNSARPLAVPLQSRTGQDLSHNPTSNAARPLAVPDPTLFLLTDPPSFSTN